MNRRTPLILLSSLAIASPAMAQHASSLRVDLVTGVTSTAGGFYVNRDQDLIDLQVAARLHRTSHGSFIAAGGMATMLGTQLAFICLPSPTGQCATDAPDFSGFTASVGFDRPLGSGSIRLLAGPAFYPELRGRPTAPHARIDIATPAWNHLALTVMGTHAVLANYDGERVRFSAFAVGLSIR